MKTTFLSLCFVCLTVNLMGAEQNPAAEDQPTQAISAVKHHLTLTLTGDNLGAKPVTQDDPVTFCIYNEGKKPVYILDFFKANGKPFSLYITIHNAEGAKVLESTNHVKVEMSSLQKYAYLRPHGSYNIPFPFREVIREYYAKGLPKGEYTVTGRYENDRGENCFKGKLVSAPVKFTVKE